MSELPISGRVDVTVDERSVDKLIDAVVDVFSPATEFLGALGDGVRLARVEMAARTTRRAKEIADANGMVLKAPPLKFLVPFFEKASLEEDGDEDLLEMWANLLVSAGSESGSAKPIYVDIMSKMTSEAAVMLREFCDVVDTAQAYKPISQAERLIQAAHYSFAASIRSPKDVELRLYAEAAAIPSIISKVSSDRLNHRRQFDFDSENSRTPTKSARRAEFDVGSARAYQWGSVGGEKAIRLLGELAALDLLREFSFDSEVYGPEMIDVYRSSVQGVYLTSLGVEFYAAVAPAR